MLSSGVHVRVRKGKHLLRDSAGDNRTAGSRLLYQKLRGPCAGATDVDTGVAFDLVLIGKAQHRSQDLAND